MALGIEATDDKATPQKAPPKEQARRSIPGYAGYCSMKTPWFLFAAPLLLAGSSPTVAAQAPDADWKQSHQQVEGRLQAVMNKASAFGPAYTPIYKAILPWYGAWGGRNNGPVDDWMTSPEVYGAELAVALSQGHNYVADHLGSTFPAWFEKRLPNGQVYRANYMLHLPAGFPAPGHKYPLTIGLPGSGWIAHKISYSSGSANKDSWISVTPILEGRRWDVGFLNAYLDELIRTFPVDPDRVYCSGHSLGAIATWEWALANPERFAAISPDDGFGQPYRAVRLKHVPVWAVHGEKDDTISSGLAEQMVSAVRAVGGTALYSNLKGAPHNIPPWFNADPVNRWYLSNVRSHERAPADPRDHLGLDTSGFSPWLIVHLPAEMYWKSDAVPGLQASDRGKEEPKLFAKVDGRDTIVDSPVLHEVDLKEQATTLWLAVPLQMQTSSNQDPSIVSLPARDMVRFVFVGTAADAASHLKTIAQQLKPGQTLSDHLWLTVLGPQGDTFGKQILECRCQLASR